MTVITNNMYKAVYKMFSFHDHISVQSLIIVLEITGWSIGYHRMVYWVSQDGLLEITGLGY